MRRKCPGVLLVLALAGCGGSAGAHHAQLHSPAPLPAAPISARSLTLSGRIVIVNGWQGAVAGQRLRVAAGHYATNGEGVALVSDAADLEREVRAPAGEGALRFLRRRGALLELRSRAGHRFSLNLRTLHLVRRGVRRTCPHGALPALLRRLQMHDTPNGLRPLPAPRSQAFAVALAILAGVHGRVEAIDARPATSAPCGMAGRTLAARVMIATQGPVVGALRRTVFVARFARGWRAWRVQG